MYLYWYWRRNKKKCLSVETQTVSHRPHSRRVAELSNSVLCSKMLRAEVRVKRAEKKVQISNKKQSSKRLRSEKKVLSENNSTRITRSQTKSSAKLQKTINIELQAVSSQPTCSKSTEKILPVQHFPSRNTRSKSEKISSITLNPDSNKKELFNKEKSQIKNTAISTIRYVKLSDFEVNTVVLAKQKYSIPWPARVLKIEKDRVFVYFFGDKRSGFVFKSEIYNFVLSASAIRATIQSKKKPPRTFCTGIAEVETIFKIPCNESLLN